MPTTNNSDCDDHGADNYDPHVDQDAHDDANTQQETGVHIQTDDYHPPTYGPWPLQNRGRPNSSDTIGGAYQGRLLGQQLIDPTVINEDNYYRQRRPPPQRRSDGINAEEVKAFPPNYRGQPPITSDPRLVPLQSYHLPSGDYNSQFAPPCATNYPSPYGNISYGQFDYRGQPHNPNYVPQPQHPTPVGHPYPQYANASYYSANPYNNVPPPLLQAPGMFYVPRKRANCHYGWCEGCNDYSCSNQITIKDYDSAERVVSGLKPNTIFRGAEDYRSGTAFIEEMNIQTEGHPDVVRYLWLKRYTTRYVWKLITDSIQPPTRCHRAYPLQLAQLLQRLHFHYDSLDHAQRVGDELARCTQGDRSVYQFIRKLETMASELHDLGAPVPYRDLKVKLHKGLRSMMLRQRLDVDLMNDYMSFEHFRDRALLHHKQLINYYGVNYDLGKNNTTTGTGQSNPKTLPYTEPRKLRKDSVDSRRGRPKTTREYTPRSSTSRDRSYQGRKTSVNYVDCDDDAESDYSIKHLLAIQRDVTGFTCFRCTKEGHSAKNCPESLPANMTTRCKICGNPAHTTDACRINTDHLLCHRCNNPGHLAYVCGAKLPAPTPSTTTRPMAGKEKGLRPTGKANTNVHATFLNDGSNQDGHYCYTLHRSQTRPPTPDPRVRRREGMMTGFITIEDTEVTAIYDTGADVSIITSDCLNYVAPDADLDTNVPNVLSAANGGSLDTIGTVELRVSTTRVSSIHTFLVTTVPLNHPVILGCPTMSRLRTRITISPTGYHIETNYTTRPVGNNVKFNDSIEHISQPVEDEDPLEDNSNEQLRDDYSNKYDYIENYKVNYINQLCYQEGLVPYENVDTATMDPGIPITTNTINVQPLIRGQGPSNNERNETKAATDFGKHSPPPKLDVLDYIQGTGDQVDYNREDEDPVEDDSGDLLDDELRILDNLPPWEVLQRDWSLDETAPLGRVIVRALWKTEARPPMNYRQAAQRGARSTSRLTTTQREAFETTLNTYVDRGFCAVVQHNNLTNYEKSPVFDDCQTAWDKLTKGTSYEGTTVMKPKHFTPAHTVFRDQHPTTPCRIVLDYRVLNTFLLRGGRSQHDLQGTLLQVRGFKYFVASDISKAFCEMKSSLYDLAYTNYTCIGNYTILWGSVAFGTNSAPNFLECSMHDITLEAESLGQVGSTLTTGPLVDPSLYNNETLEEILLRPSQDAYDYIRTGPAIPLKLVLLKYVDDLFNGGDSIELAETSNDFSLHLLGGHGFKCDAVKNVVSWTNSTQENDTRKSLLGYHYNDEKLYVVYSGEFPDGPTTKREACSALSSLYDPLGLLIEYDLKGRLIWRRICERCKLWTDTIDTNVANDIKDWITECTVATTIGIPRYIGVNHQPLLVSTDASCDLWGVDIRCADTTTVSPRLLSRGGVFPKGQVKWTIPRKELVALYKGLQLLKAMSPYLMSRWGKIRVAYLDRGSLIHDRGSS
ncbi:hypothetical protein Pmar_PMAR001809 [Perkinsus marinus ATCC 50983]|uniref:CCHC-type domain-containing protein n=1 Tax=Perkinsus marinus (strain ATCC 50983 / TXsc) TaxID=423536 RepID=C5LJP7_PERM5|nr:hypothetical protein Pmar_PMAR001809 [Perkinsus marinus ATCC 50983]EER03064.1 hypothetical protein Pmar_PMAR001809 [Perkinsus marinus ATCC 50983]|eukprot:XP_002771248.1 hypothetical protein Pmar_PMAR001809 [Perkinsus marinus ATCC 50983]